MKRVFILSGHKWRIQRGWSQAFHGCAPQKNLKEAVTGCQNGNSHCVKADDFARRESWNTVPEEFWDVSL